MFSVTGWASATPRRASDGVAETWYATHTSMLADLTAAQRMLAEYMSDLSEEAYCAGWMQYLEYALWQVVLGERHDYGRVEFRPEDVDSLQQLSHECAGWIVFDHERGEMWLPRKEWEERFVAWMKTPAAKRVGG